MESSAALVTITHKCVQCISQKSCMRFHITQLTSGSRPLTFFLSRQFINWHWIMFTGDVCTVSFQGEHEQSYEELTSNLWCDLQHGTCAWQVTICIVYNMQRAWNSVSSNGDLDLWINCWCFVASWSKQTMVAESALHRCKRALQWKLPFWILVKGVEFLVNLPLWYLMDKTQNSDTGHWATSLVNDFYCKHVITSMVNIMCYNCMPLLST